ncbi:amidohydrolase family protein [Bosea sp. (in: a-proteobacteria)]|uniref:amidohydrolase family protein n=1 Tax=Bosea sp. (in: a-proteobacteria) TaxID=1871050 RepID=UPI003340C469
MSGAELYTGPIIDAHHHVWEPRKHNYPWLSGALLVPHRYGDYTPVKRDYLPADYRRDAEGVNIAATVYVEAEWDPADPLGETRYVSGLAREHGLPNAIVAQAWLHRDDVGEVLAGQAGFGLVRSVRHKPEGAASPAEVAAGRRTLMSDERWRSGYALLERHGLHFDLQTPWWNLAEAAELARDFPRTTLIVNHAGVPGDRSPETLAGWRAGMEALAARPNVVVKISGLCLPGRAWSVEDNAEVVTTILRLFGPQRVMFGSNFPVDGLCASFGEIFDGFRRIASSWSPAEQRAMFWETGLRIYRPELSDADRGMLTA